MGAAEELVQHLRWVPDHQASVALARLRVCEDASSALSYFRGGPTGYRLSEQSTALSFLPPVQSDTELELMVRHPTAFPPLDASVDLQLGLRPARWQAQMQLWDRDRADEVALQQSGSHPTAESSASSVAMTVPPSQSGISSLSIAPVQVGPSLQPRYANPRLSRLNIKFWSTVSVTNHYAAEAISLYLETDHPLIALFDPDTLLDALVEADLDQCSSFLVNALLAFASVRPFLSLPFCWTLLPCPRAISHSTNYDDQLGYSSKCSEAAAKSLDFEREAEHLWRAEQSTDSNATLIALVLLYLSLLFHSKNEEAFRCIEEASRMAARMGLFGTADRLSAQRLRQLPEKSQKAAVFAAWGTFNIVT
jgi:hypothetical protein